MERKHLNKHIIELNEEFLSDEHSLESFKKLRTNLLYTDDLKVISETSTIPDEGKTVTTFNLAKVFAEMGKKVLLIDADLRRSSLKNYLMINTKDIPGLSEALTNQSETYICDTNIANLSIMLSGKRPPNPSEMLSNNRFNKVIDDLKDDYDYIIIDTPPVAAGADASIIGRVADGIILVIRNDFTKKNAVKRSLKELEANGGRVIGCVLNRVKKDSSEYGHYGYYDYYY